MTMHYTIATGAIGVIFAVIILLLIRRDILHPRYSLIWLLTSLLLVVLAVFPRIIDALGAMLGVTYPPTLALTVGLCILLVKVLTQDIERSRMSMDIRKLTQRLALLERMQDHEKKDDDPI